VVALFVHHEFYRIRIAVNAPSGAGFALEGSSTELPEGVDLTPEFLGEAKCESSSARG
jgi:hypothetical protein